MTERRGGSSQIIYADKSQVEESKEDSVEVEKSDKKDEKPSKTKKSEDKSNG